MLRRILVDAAHAEEVRLVMTVDGRVSELDYKNETKKNIKGNVYLAKVNRVEASLQAAFVDYGGDKQGFLPLAEIHPDYYQLPKADKELLMKMVKQEKQSKEDGIENNSEEESEGREFDNFRFYKKYKIQEIIKKDQIILVQASKEERGNKGATLTTYLSLAGRYCVLMPNAYKGGGISRKIEEIEERNRLKDLIDELTKDDDRASVIVRTAGAHKTKMEIKRDYNYLKRLWENIRKHTLSSIAPTFIHEEGDIIKKAIRDMYDSDVEEILISGHHAFQNARDFMKLLLPKHVDKIKEYTDKLPIFSRYGVDEQVASLYNNEVPLKSGGAIVINQTEALVAIDVNSGRLTSENTLESTALKTNLEAVSEISKQLRLRDLSGLLVIDFIDMLESQNRKLVEKALKEAVSRDRARIQIGRIGEFGLLEMSRQRLRSSFSEAHLLKCDHCMGTGKIRPLLSTAIALIKAIEREAFDLKGEVVVSGSKDLILCMLNTFKERMLELEEKFAVKVRFGIDEAAGIDGFFIEKRKIATPSHSTSALSSIDNEVYREEKQGEAELEKKHDKRHGAHGTHKDKAGPKIKDAGQNLPEQNEEERPSHGHSGHRRKISERNVGRRDQKERHPSRADKDSQSAIQATPSDENSSFLKEIWKKIMD